MHLECVTCPSGIWEAGTPLISIPEHSDKPPAPQPPGLPDDHTRSYAAVENLVQFLSLP